MNNTNIYKLTRDNKLHIRLGLNGNYYLFSKDSDKLRKACDIIGRSRTAVYYRKEYECFRLDFGLII